jgi:acetyl-CoA carboxylase biotin carboxylase subunit
MECRVCAEDPEMNFLPSPGTIASVAEPSGPGVRVDSGVYSGWTVPLEYDSLLAKLIGFGESREQAVARLLRALGEYSIAGIRTNLDFLGAVLEDPVFQSGNLHTGFLDDFFKRRVTAAVPADRALAVALAAVAAASTAGSAPAPGAGPQKSTWLEQGRTGLLR